MKTLVAESPQGSVPWTDRPPTIRYMSHFTTRLGALAQRLSRRARLRPAGFDAAHYLSAYPDVASAGIEAGRHFVRFGEREGRTRSSRDLSMPAMVSALASVGLHGAPSKIDPVTALEQFTRAVSGCQPAALRRMCAPLWRLYGRTPADGLANIDAALLGRLPNGEDGRGPRALPQPLRIAALTHALLSVGHEHVAEHAPAADVIALGELFILDPSRTLAFVETYYRPDHGSTPSAAALLRAATDAINQVAPILRGDDLPDVLQVNDLNPRARELAIVMLLERLRAARASTVDGRPLAILAIPSLRAGGFNQQAMRVARAMAATHAVILLSTESAEREREDWIPEPVLLISAHDLLQPFPPSERADILYAVIAELRPSWLIIENSSSALASVRTHGARLARLTRIATMLSCFDGPPNEPWFGNSAMFGASLAQHADVVVVDGSRHRAELLDLFAMGPDTVIHLPIPHDGIAQTPWVPRLLEGRPRVLWAGHPSRQKRVDILLDVARLLPEFGFDAWGLESSLNFRDVPDNVTARGAFANLKDTAWQDTSAFLFTSAWEGVPKILIEAGSLGLPVVAAGVGSVSDLIDEATGWRIDEQDDVLGYVAALRAAIGDPNEAGRRGGALLARVRSQNDPQTFDRSVIELFR